MIHLFVIADDFTGALDTGVQFASYGAATKVVVGTGLQALEADAQTQVLVVDAETRHLPAAQAYDTVYRLVRWAKEKKIGCIYKKTDSALRGNIGAELSAALAADGGDRLHFVPAFPNLDRVTRGGVHYIGGVPVAQSVFGKDPFEPVTHSRVEDILHEQTDTLCAYIPGGGSAEGKAGVLVYEAQTNRDMAQIADRLAARLEPFGVNVTLLVGGMKAKEKRIALEAIADGRANLVVGTHAVLTDTVEFKNLGLAIVDEQHRFGVRQRGLLAGKAQSPHLLVMSATPIPRTLGLLMYGDLDISVLDELPPGRKPIKTWFITGKKRRDMYGFLDKQIAAGHQVYIVCPAIEENEAMGDLQAVTTYYTETACALLPNRRIGLLHGKLKPKEKDDVMQRFKAGELDVLVSTTVIEVGVDVPNATVMVIENAERFGLSALHQLRGRVGRGAADSCCILISDNGNDAVRERLQFLCRTSDGFAVAKYDLETRGPGDFFGSAQHGLPTLRVADLVQDTRTLRVAQDEAKALLAKDPNLIDPAHRALSDEVERLFETAGAMN